MADITLVRQQQAEIAEADREAARRAIFGVVDGLGDQGRKQWRRLWNSIFRLEPGEMLEIRTHKERLGWYHRKHMALESKVFEAQERFKDFDAFRDWLKVGAGHVNWYPGPKGGVIPVPKPISYARLEQTDMEEFHAKAVEFLRQPYAIKTLWPAAPAHLAAAMIEDVLGKFGE
ncbi:MULTISPECIES: DUF1367 family protein [unclassified Achromobacter]|uniref:DUF1367 family protein n=1 Tax=unclassified Achromobacter TaxID=2626865 RepID=UPI000B516103|nr:MULTISPECIES: DUF1367 family protein [unclassified Achromobacter]OWT69231.1 hypothetical protein CEY05_28835 [Achromobacter sp. HZ34]OWT70636.1 hypothetical protein CEY04_27665 [Achromobacter sp. HZ28]